MKNEYINQFFIYLTQVCLYQHKIIIYIERDNMKKFLETKYQINLVPCIQYYDKGKKKS